MMVADAATQHPTLAEKLTRLFQTVRSPDGDEYTYGEVVAEINARGIAKTSDTYLCDLRNGTKDNPRIKHVEAIANFFGVPATYFLDGDESAARLYSQLAALPVYGDPDVERIALLMIDLPPAVRKAITQIIEHAYQIG
ncbi:MAG: XRE family transcriptional regulator [Chloroflexota bacterium]|nr:XRE family transcriptional regulator [Chloroflexota bacterium]